MCFNKYKYRVWLFFWKYYFLSQTTQITENCFRVSELILLIHLFWKQKIMFFKNESYTVLLLVEPHFVWNFETIWSNSWFLGLHHKILKIWVRITVRLRNPLSSRSCISLNMSRRDIIFECVVYFRVYFHNLRIVIIFIKFFAC